MSEGIDVGFTGSVPEIYERYLVPLIFEPYAADLASRLVKLDSRSVVEVACGTGVVTRALAAGLDGATTITATDLNRPMVDHAAGIGTAREVDWRQADVMDLPFGDRSFDTVVCQFGVMFFPDKPAAFAEIRRVLKPGGAFVYNTWDRIEANEFADVVTTVARLSHVTSEAWTAIADRFGNPTLMGSSGVSSSPHERPSSERPT